ncbi:hypothetical protein B4923_17085 [Brenneria roseae subsp. americana]|uniref:Uncharacterized protein n=1 Tax=Brenneria roseae subsp. americana TaxID=1508507 RepID=A0A2U1TLA5_9GAMM|nr:hypothetical protein [Brenneria roseae]PWC10149.1 hypothetical protein B4923_17085 [Brenneria roseae subsp. americana]
MVIPDIQPLNVNLQLNLPTAGVATNADAVPPIGTGNKTDTSTTNSDSSHSNSMASDSDTKVTLSSDKKRVADSDNAEKKADEKKEEQPKPSAEYTLTMTGIPLYNGKLVSLVKYPDGQSEMFDAFTGKRITQEDLALLNFLQGSGTAQELLTFESSVSYSNMSAAEVYQQIQEMLHGR